MSYESWKEKNVENLFDGTKSKKTYIRSAYYDGGQIECGLQPRLMRHGSSLVLAFRLRIAYVTSPKASHRVKNPDDPNANVVSFPVSAPGEKSNKVKHLISFGPDVPWSKFDDKRISVTGAVQMPFNPAEGAEFLKALEDGALEKLLTTIPGPVGGFFQNTTFVNVLKDYLVESCDQFDLFVENISALAPADSLSVGQKKWLDELTAKAEAGKAAGEPAVDTAATEDATDEAPAKKQLAAGDEIDSETIPDNE